MTKNLGFLAVATAMLLTAGTPAVSLAASLRVIDVEIGSYYIKPDKISVKARQPVTLKIKNQAWLIPHDLVVEAPSAGVNFKVALRGGQSGSVTFTPTRPGKYRMYCDKKPFFGKSHEARGMRGVLEVVP
ncbi:MAG: cupredoxin domain-containing protein [Acidiferrobacterales bacterium]